VRNIEDEQGRRESSRLRPLPSDSSGVRITFTVVGMVGMGGLTGVLPQTATGLYAIRDRSSA